MPAESDDPKGLYAVRCTPNSFAVSSSASCLCSGCSSTWLTAGGTRALSQSSRNFFPEKFDTPIDLTLFAFLRSSIAAHVSAVGGESFSPSTPVTGQW
eukprot:CAMPEP_0180003724 /NCGR_PEP_ID=MMETSP0984-20121128/11692_1 /TAXON_ID=483367 /ORGANISM="non described non described, Strain CCMP 2436" /LENGTH=97 /DNA_ID=CAMNT_0021924143 /DNA_START=371 /DNA_END=661 /DNA_ORIENTATION=-